MDSTKINHALKDALNTIDDNFKKASTFLKSLTPDATSIFSKGILAHSDGKHSIVLKELKVLPMTEQVIEAGVELRYSALIGITDVAGGVYNVDVYRVGSLTQIADCAHKLSNTAIA